MCAQRNGPDWTDILSVLKTLEEVHDRAVVIHLWAGGSKHGGELLCVVSAHQTKGFIGLLGEAPSVWEGWPNRTDSEVPLMVHRLLCELDYKLTKEVGSAAEPTEKV